MKKLIFVCILISVLFIIGGSGVVHQTTQDYINITDIFVFTDTDSVATWVRLDFHIQKINGNYYTLVRNEDSTFSLVVYDKDTICPVCVRGDIDGDGEVGPIDLSRLVDFLFNGAEL